MSPTETQAPLTAEELAEVAQLLRRTRARLTPPYAWTKGRFARRDTGHDVCWADPAAMCWCLEGALLAERAGVRAPFPAVIHERAVEELYVTLGLSPTQGLALAGWNDFAGREHQEVLDVLTFTAARLERVQAGAAA